MHIDRIRQAILARPDFWSTFDVPPENALIMLESPLVQQRLKALVMQQSFMGYSDDEMEAMMMGLVMGVTIMTPPVYLADPTDIPI